MQLFLILIITFGAFLTFAVVLLWTERRKRFRPIVRDPEDTVISAKQPSTVAAGMGQERQFTKSMAASTQSTRTFSDSVPATQANVGTVSRSKSRDMKSTLAGEVSSNFRAPRRGKI